MTWADTSAVVTTIKTVPILASAVYVTEAPKPTAPATVLPLPYVIVHPADGVDEQARFTGPDTIQSPEVTLHIVGESANQVQVVTSLVRAKFQPSTSGFVIPPTVSGRRNRDAYWRAPTPIQSDRDVTPHLIYQVIELGWVSEPA